MEIIKRFNGIFPWIMVVIGVVGLILDINFNTYGISTAISGFLIGSGIEQVISKYC